MADKAQFFRINNVPVPDGGTPYNVFLDFYPKRCPGVLQPPLTGAKDGVGRPIAAPGFPTTVFKWYDTISVPCYQFWRGFVGTYATCAVLNDIVLPDPNSFDTVNDFPYHSQITSGLLWKIQLDGGENAYVAAMNGGQMWIRGGATIKITELGGGPFS